MLSVAALAQLAKCRKGKSGVRRQSKAVDQELSASFFFFNKTYQVGQMKTHEPEHAHSTHLMMGLQSLPL